MPLPATKSWQSILTIDQPSRRIKLDTEQPSTRGQNAIWYPCEITLREQRVAVILAKVSFRYPISEGDNSSLVAELERKAGERKDRMGVLIEMSGKEQTDTTRSW